MYEMATGEPPFSKYIKSNESLFDAIAAARREDIEVEGADEDFNDLLLKCMAKVAGDRCTMQEVLEHPYLSGAENMKELWVAEYQRLKIL